VECLRFCGRVSVYLEVRIWPAQPPVAFFLPHSGPSSSSQKKRGNPPLNGYDHAASLSRETASVPVSPISRPLSLLGILRGHTRLFRRCYKCESPPHKKYLQSWIAGGIIAGSHLIPF